MTRTGTSRRLWAATALAVVATLGTAVGAAADDIENSIDAVAEEMPLNVGGSNGTTTLKVQPRNGDGDAGCNFEPGGGSLTLSIASSNTSVATVSPSTATFTGCGSTSTLIVTPVATGTATISATQVTNTTAGTFNLAPATFTVTVAGPSNTAPSVAVTGVTNGASYEKGSVPPATCEVTDAEDGPSTFPAALSGSPDADGLGSQTATCSYTDAGLLTVSASKTYSIVDSSPPVIGYELDPVSPDGLDSWYRGTVTLTWTVSEPGSPNSLVKTGCVDQTIAADQLDTAYSCSATSSGGAADEVSVSVKRDGNAPSVSYSSASPASPDGDNGWYRSPVTATFTALDGFSGPASQTGTATSTDDGVAVVLSSPALTDNAGNTAAAGTAQSPAFKIDTTAPEAPVFVGGPAASSSHYYGSLPAAPTCTSSDATSELASCIVTGYGTAVGSHTMTATATDNAGNTSSVSRGYTVLAWTGRGFYSPVDMNGVWNKVKGGSTVPLKFELFAGTTELTDVAAVNTFAYRSVQCDNSLPSDDVEMVTSGATSLRYDTTGGQFIQNWKVPTATGCYRAVMTADDGTAITALFKVVK